MDRTEPHGGARRPGRPLRLPIDETPENSRYVDASSRLAWLLVSLRLHSGTGEPVGRGEIVSMLHDRGVAADLTRVSRWESGQHPPPTRVLLAYEQRLGLPAGVLVAIARMLLRSTPNAPVAGGGGQGPFNEMSADEVLEQLISRVMVGRDDSDSATLSGGEWLRLAIELDTFQKVFLDPALWSRLSRRLLVELARTSGSAELLRSEAGATLLGHPAARRRMLPALGEWMLSTEAQLFDPMVGMLGTVADLAAGELVIRLMNSPQPMVREAALRAAAVKLVRGHFGSDSISRLEQSSIARLSVAHPRLTPGLLDLVAHLPRASSSRAIAAVHDRSVQRQLRATCSTKLLVSSEMSRGVARSVTEVARSRVLPRGASESDPMLVRLVTEALFHVSDARRRLAAQVLRICPFNQAISDHCVELATGPNGLLAARAWELLETLSATPSHMLSAALSEHRPGLQVAALRTLAHSAEPVGVGASHELAHHFARAADESTQLATVGALARCTTQGLAHIAPTSETVRAAVQWWQELGMPIRDRPEGTFHQTRTVS